MSDTPAEADGMKASHIAGWILVLVAIVGGFQFARWRMESGQPRNGPGTGPVGPGNEGTQGGPSKMSLGVQLARGTDDETVVDDVLEGGHGAKAGLAPGDVILAVDGQALSWVGEPYPRPQPLIDRLQALLPGEALVLRVRRAADGAEVELPVRFEGLGYETSYAHVLVRAAIEQLWEERREDGLWPHYQDPERPSVAVSALVAFALARAGDDLEEGRQAWVDELLEQLLGHRGEGEDLGLHDPAQLVEHRVYASALVVQALGIRRSPEDPEAQALAAWLARQQVQEAQGYDPIDSRYGGWSYYDDFRGDSLRTDISTARFALAGLDAAAWPAAQPAWFRAGLFLDLVQNQTLLTRTGDPLYAQEQRLRDGGFAFTPRMSKAGDTELGPDLLLGRSYGSATCDGLLALMATRGIDRRRELGTAPLDDARVLAALRWLARSYSVEENPGFGQDPVGWGQGLFFYYQAALAQALHRAGVWELVTEDGEVHVWAREVVRHLGFRHGLKRRSFAGDSGLMHEDRPTVAASFALIALAAARDRLELGGGWRLEAGAPPPRLPAEVEPPAPLPADAVGRGMLLFQQLGCTGCHVDGQAANAPSLVGVGDLYLGTLRSQEAAQARLRRYLRDATAVSALQPGRYGAQMPPFPEALVSEEKLGDLVSFLLSRSGSRPVSEARPAKVQ